MKGWADESVCIFFVSSPSSTWSLDAEAVKGPQNISTLTWKTWLANKPKLTSIQPKHGFRFDKSGKTYLTYLPGKYRTLLISGLGSQNYCGPGNSKCQAHSQKKIVYIKHKVECLGEAIHKKCIFLLDIVQKWPWPPTLILDIREVTFVSAHFGHLWVNFCIGPKLKSVLNF